MKKPSQRDRRKIGCADKRFGRVSLVLEGSERFPIRFCIGRRCLTQCDVDHSGMSCRREQAEKYPWCNLSLERDFSTNNHSTSPESVIPLTVGVILQPNRAYSVIDGGRLVTMRSISSPPLVRPRLGLTRDNTGTSIAASSTGAADVCKVPCCPATSDCPLSGGIGIDTPV